MAKKFGISLRAYAKHRGITHAAVSKAIESGRINAFPDGSIDMEQADKDWSENTNFAKVRTTSKPTTFADAQILKIKAEATLAQLKVKKEIGAVIPTDEVIIFTRVLTADLSDHFLSLGRNIAPHLVGENDIIKITRIIDATVKKLIMDYKNDLEDRISKTTAKIMDSEDS